MIGPFPNVPLAERGRMVALRSISPALANNPWGAQLFGASFYVLTGFHGCHVIAGIIYLTVILLLGLRGRYHSGNINPVAIAGLYWYFVDVSWLFIFFVVYVL